MKKTNSYLLSSLLLLFSHAILANPSTSKLGWEIIAVKKELKITDDGSSKTIHPACAFDFIQGPDGPIDNSFHFYYKQGQSKKLVVYFNGGGACWDDSTCVASLALDQPAYNPTVHIANTPIGAGGILDDSNKDNPFRKWSKVFIPYCTGDLHVGSNDYTYEDVVGSITTIPGTEINVKHHGSDNFLAVREWIKNHYTSDANGKMAKIENLLVTGSSAGGYGATLNFPYLQETFPESKAVLFADASEGVVTQGFLDTVFSTENENNWNLGETLPTIFAEQLGSFTEAEFIDDEFQEGFNAQLFTTLTDTYPKNRFAQYTTARDFVQVLFLKIMTLIDAGVDNSALKSARSDNDIFESWNSRMEASLDSIAESTDNYQYYIGEGNFIGDAGFHMVLIDAFSPPNVFYTENSAEGVYFTDWLDSFVNDPIFNEENLMYSN